MLAVVDLLAVGGIEYVSFDSTVELQVKIAFKNTSSFLAPDIFLEVF